MISHDHTQDHILLLDIHMTFTCVPHGTGELWQPGEPAAAAGESELLWTGLP